MIMTTKEIIEQIQAIQTTEDMEAVQALIRAQPGKMSAEVQDALLAKLDEVTQQSRELIEEAKNVLVLHGLAYPLTDWLTPAAYARKFNIENVATVTNWINRGVIPAENVKEIPELGIRLIKAVEYQPRPYKRNDDPAGDR